MGLRPALNQEKNMSKNAKQENHEKSLDNTFDRRKFLTSAGAAAAMMAALLWALGNTLTGFNHGSSAAFLQSSGPGDLAPIRAQIEKNHTQAVERLQTWIRQPSIAAENR